MSVVLKKGFTLFGYFTSIFGIEASESVKHYKILNIDIPDEQHLGYIEAFYSCSLL